MKTKNKVKSSKNITDTENKLDWANFNFLENLLIFCLMNERVAPKESGVTFRITPNKTDKSICLLFEIDRKKDPLFETGELRPDFMAWYVSGNLCICTVIEMKGAAQKRIKHAIEQVKVLRTKIREEIVENLPTKFKFQFQAIILSPFNTSVPNELIAEENQKGLSLIALQYSHKAELFPYISKINKYTERFSHVNVRDGREDSVVETILINGARPYRLKDDFYEKHSEKACKNAGIYINYEVDQTCYLALTSDRNEAEIKVSEKGNKISKDIEDNLNDIGLNGLRKFKITEN